MTRKRSRFWALVLAVCLGVSLIPGGLFISSARAETYGMVINGSVRLRREASTSSAYWFSMPVGWICTIHSETTKNGVHWYRVIAPHPEASNPATARTYWGYVTEEFFRPLTDAETAQYLAAGGVNASSGSSSASVPATAAPSSASSAANTSAASGTTGSITNGGTNFREGPSKKAHSMMKLDRGTVVSITSMPDGVGEDYWYGVSYAGKNGYVNSEFVRVISGSSAAAVTISPTASPTPPPSTGNSNAVQLIKSSAHLRNSPNGVYDRDKDWEGTGSILPLAGSAKSAAGYTWYPVSRDGSVYYVRSDCVQLITSTQVTAAPVATATPAPTAAAQDNSSSSGTTAALGYVRTTKGGCNLRATPAGTTIKQIPRNRTLPYLLAPVEKSGYTWYYVEADGNRGYLRSDVVTVVSGSTGTGTTEQAATVASVTPDPSATGYVKTIASDVNLRVKAGYSSMIGRVNKNVVMPYYGTPTTVNGVTWYHVRHATLGSGYIHGSYVAVVNADGSATPTPEPTAAPTGTVVKLLDEPFSALDAKIRMEMREELRKIQTDLNITVIFVTHDQEEAMMLSDRIVVMSKGHIEQMGSPREIYDNPATRFVAGFIGEMNFLDDGSGKQIAVRPEHITVTKGTDKGVLHGTVRTVMMLGHYLEMTLDTEKGLVKVYINSDQADQFEKGDKVALNFDHTYTYSGE